MMNLELMGQEILQVGATTPNTLLIMPFAKQKTQKCKILMINQYH